MIRKESIKVYCEEGEGGKKTKMERKRERILP